MARFVFSGGGKPFRVAALGSDAITGGYEEMLFDGDFVTLPIYAQGQFSKTYGVQFVIGSPTYLRYLNVNTFNFGKTFAAPPLFTALSALDTGTKYDLHWKGTNNLNKSDWEYETNTASRAYTPYGSGSWNYGNGTGSARVIGCFATTSAFRSNEPVRYIIFDKPLG